MSDERERGGRDRDQFKVMCLNLPEVTEKKHEYFSHVSDDVLANDGALC
jgi:hypothetical protein